MFGSNMRPGGGILGASVAVGGGTEHQGYGTPHLHFEVHVACAYQYDTLDKVMAKLEAGKFTFQQWLDYQEWLHKEDVLEENTKQELAGDLENQWNRRFSTKENDDMSLNPSFLSDDTNRLDTFHVASMNVDQSDLQRDAEFFKREYMKDAQSIFSRVQHHMHKRTKTGEYIPLKSCQRKLSSRHGVLPVRSKLECKAGFPKKIVRNSVLVCQGVAKKYGLSTSGRKDMYGSFLGKRRCEWQSGATPAFAVGFRSNTHSLPNWRLVPTAETHASHICRSTKCCAHDSRSIKILSKAAQRAQRRCTGYYCGYTFKTQPVGKKHMKLATDSLDYLHDSLRTKTPAQQFFRCSHRMLVDHCHRCMKRTAAEEWNLAGNYHDQDPTIAEFFRTYRSRDFPGGSLVKRLEIEKERKVTKIYKVLPASTVEPKDEASVHVRNFVEFYGYRGNHTQNPGVLLLSPWEFCMWWDIIPLGNKPDIMESPTLLRFPTIPGAQGCNA